MKDHVAFHLPRKPLSLIDAINRCAAATGSIHNAMLTADADYNGHALSLTWNDYRSYYVCEYYWGERVVIARSANFAIALAAAKREFSRQGRGAILRVSVRPQDADIARNDPDLIEGVEVEDPSRDWKFNEVGFAVRHHHTHHLIAATSREHFRQLWMNLKGNEA